MRSRPVIAFRPGLERFEAKLLPSANPVSSHVARIEGTTEPQAIRQAGATDAGASDGEGSAVLAAPSARANPGAKVQLSRITTPKNNSARLIPPFAQVLVQDPSRTPLPGRQTNLLFVSVRNSTNRTFDASDGFRVRVTGQRQSVPVLTGSDQWKPGEFRVFYIFTKKYYPLSPVTSAGFEFDFKGTRGVAIPGPSGIFLRLPYRPRKFAETLDRIVSKGPGARGHELGLPDTAIWEISPASRYIIPL